MSAPYTITVYVNDKPVTFNEPLTDPFHNTRVHIAWRDLVRMLLRGHGEVTVSVSGDRDIVERVLELDPDYLGPPGSPSRTAWNAQLQGALHAFASEPAVSSEEGGGTMNAPAAGAASASTGLLHTTGGDGPIRLSGDAMYPCCSDERAWSSSSPRARL